MFGFPKIGPIRRQNCWNLGTGWNACMLRVIVKYILSPRDKQPRVLASKSDVTMRDPVIINYAQLMLLRDSAFQRERSERYVRNLSSSSFGKR